MLAGPATQPPGSAPRSAVSVLGRELSVPFLLLLPVAGLLLLSARPGLDVMYQHDIGARNEYRHARSLPGAFGGLYLDSTLDRIDRRRAAALSGLVAALRAGEPLSPILAAAREDWASPEEVALLGGAAHQLHQTDALFRTYVSPQLASGLEAHPELAVLGGEEREVSVLFADLAGFTAFAAAAG